MVTLTLDRSAQEKLGQRHHQRTRRLIEESRQPPDWELPDELPQQRGMTIDQCRKGMQVKELISPYRTGSIVGFKSISGIRCPVVDWQPFRSWSGHRSAIHPAAIEPLPQIKTPPSEPQLPDGVMSVGLSLF